MKFIKLMIVDDERQIRLGLSEGIPWQNHGIDQIFVAENGQTALELFERERPGVVITDIKMPGMDGLELTRRIKALEPDTLVILLTGFADFEYARSGIRAGVYEYMLKPVNIEELIACVRRGIVESESDEAEPQDELDTAAYSPWVRSAIEYIHQRYAYDITLERVAEHVNKTPNYFSGVFKKETGVSFSQFLNRYRIKKAMELLSDVSMHVYEVGEHVGYRAYDHFVRKFVGHTGETPTAYRKRVYQDGGCSGKDE